MRINREEYPQSQCTDHLFFGQLGVAFTDAAAEAGHETNHILKQRMFFVNILSSVPDTDP